MRLWVGVEDFRHGAPLPMGDGQPSVNAWISSWQRHCSATFVSHEQDGSTYLAARIAAFLSAHGSVRLCADCVVGTLPNRSLATRRVTEPGWCESCGSHGADTFRRPLAEYLRAPRRRASRTASSPNIPSTEAPSTVSARCPICSGAIEPADSAGLVFRPDGRVERGLCRSGLSMVPAAGRSVAAQAPQRPGHLSSGLPPREPVGARHLGRQRGIPVDGDL
jgi:hypothetical protein